MTDREPIFNDAQWQHIEPLMPTCKAHLGEAHRAFFDALLWMARTSSPCCDLPERLRTWSVGSCISLCVLVLKKAFRAPFSRTCSSPT
ncbi:transposase [Polaromonas sp.]|uniref:transposase n=1 Tax=Polaromonas sp. TaxID=1869339 RepID=UPI00345A198C